MHRFRIALVALVATLLLTACAAPTLAPHVIGALVAARNNTVPAGTIVEVPCSQVGLGNACSGGLPSSGQISAFVRFVNAEAARGYRWLGNANGEQIFCNPKSGVCSTPYFIFQAQ